LTSKAAVDATRDLRKATFIRQFIESSRLPKLGGAAGGVERLLEKFRMAK
jgi:hypothetical protein